MPLNRQLVRQKTAKTINGLLYSVRPNIKGVFTPIVSRSNCTATGSISSFTANVGANVVAGTGDCIDRGIELNASSSSALFGASSSVQPAGLYGLLLIRFQ